MNVAPLVNRHLVYSRPDETLADASVKIAHGLRDGVPVCGGDGRLVGILDTLAICVGAQAVRRPLAEILVREAPLQDGPVCTVDDDAAEIAQRLLQLGLRHMVVVDGARRLVGQVSRDVLLAATRGSEMLLRLVERGSEPWVASAPFPGWTYLTDCRELLSCDGSHGRLSAHEGLALLCFAEMPRRVVDRDHLMQAVCGRPHDPGDRYVDVLVGTLRRKLGDGESAARLIRTVRGVGYLLDAHVVGTA